MAPTGSLLLEYLATPNVGIFFRTDFLTTEDDVTFTDLNDEELFYNHAAFNIGYFGLGGRYYIPASEKFFISIGADAGMFMNYQSFWEVNYLHNEETPSAEERYAVVDFTNMFFGANIEAGAKFMVSDIVGLGANVGYRIASMPIAYPEGDTLDYPFDNVDGSGEKIFKATAIDLSGVYFGAGLSFISAVQKAPLPQHQQQAQNQQRLQALHQSMKSGAIITTNRKIIKARLSITAAPLNRHLTRGFIRRLVCAITTWATRQGLPSTLNTISVRTLLTHRFRTGLTKRKVNLIKPKPGTNRAGLYDRNYCKNEGQRDGCTEGQVKR